jgi:hypothetical protein
VPLEMQSITSAQAVRVNEHGEPSLFTV